MAELTRTIVNFDRRFARPYQLNQPAIEAAIAACPQILINAYVMGVIDGMTGRRRPCPSVLDRATDEPKRISHGSFAPSQPTLGATP